MGNPTSDGIYGPHDAKHDCPRPMVGCRYPKCDCDVDEDETSMSEAAEERHSDEVHESEVEF